MTRIPRIERPARWSKKPSAKSAVNSHLGSPLRQIVRSSKSETSEEPRPRIIIKLHGPLGGRVLGHAVKRPVKSHEPLRRRIVQPAHVLAGNDRAPTGGIHEHSDCEAGDPDPGGGLGARFLVHAGVQVCRRVLWCGESDALRFSQRSTRQNKDARGFLPDQAGHDRHVGIFCSRSKGLL